jgi:hypothetical protein
MWLNGVLQRIKKLSKETLNAAKIVGLYSLRGYHMGIQVYGAAPAADF